MKQKVKQIYQSFLRFKRNFRKFTLEKVKIHELILHWLKSRLSRSQFLILSGILVGITAGIAGVILKTLVHQIHFFITHNLHFEFQILFFLIFPFLGIVLTTLIVLFIFKGQDRKGIGAILYEIAQHSSIVSSVKMYSQMIQSAVTVGLGGSAGLESPIAVTGAAIGSNYARTYKLHYRDRTLLLAAGATAGIASAFNAPIAGIMFAIEILLTGVIFSDFIPLVVAAVCGSLVSKVMLQEDVLFRFHSREAFNYHNVPYYLVLGIFCGIYARYFVVISQRVEHFIHNLKFSRIQKAALGGITLSLLCVLLPPLFGEGYDVIKSFTSDQSAVEIHHSFFRYLDLGNWSLIIFLVLILLAKAFATSITIYSGGNGGNFAPSLFAGGTLGFLFASLCKIAGFSNVPVTNLILAGMAGVMSGALYAPLTAIFLIAESSSGFDLFIPLMIVSVIAFLVGKWYSPIAPDLKPLADQGKIFTKEHDKNLLSTLRTEDFIDRDSPTILLDASIDDLADMIKASVKNTFAVVDQDRHLMGILTFEELRIVIFNKSDLTKVSITELMKVPTVAIHPQDDMTSVIQTFDEANTWLLPVVNANDEFMGFLSKSNILDQYRELLREYS